MAAITTISQKNGLSISVMSSNVDNDSPFLLIERTLD
jgi:hypothetical protein